MDNDGRIKMTVELDVTVPQALAMQAMFEYMNELSSQGASRVAGFFADGDGNFHPKAKCSFSEEIPELTDGMKKVSAIELKQASYLSIGDRYYDYDPIAWGLIGETLFPGE